MFGSVNCDHLIIRLPYRLRFSEVSGPSIPRILSFWYRSFLVERAHPFQKGTDGGKWQRRGNPSLGKGKEKGRRVGGRRAQGRSLQGVDLVTVVNFLNRLLLRLVAHEVIEEIARTVLVTDSATQPWCATLPCVRDLFPAWFVFARRSGMIHDQSMRAGFFYAWCTPNV